MLIGICGGICAGKNTIAQYLVDHHGFSHLCLESKQADTTVDATQTTDGTYESQESHATNDINGDNISSLSPTAGSNGVPSTLSDSTKNGTVEKLKQNSNAHTFSSPEALLDFVTKRWRERWVTTSIPNERVLDLLERRPFFILISVDAPVSVRYTRYKARYASSPPITLEHFLQNSDAHLYCPQFGLLPLISRATIRLLNTSSSLPHLYATLGKLDLTNHERLRPSWDQYFMRLASLAAQRSNCMKRRVGCVLVRSNRVISTGYNGTPRGLVNCSSGGCARCNSAQSSGVGLGTCLCLHAEENALLEAGRDRVGGEAILYCDTCPCLTCSIKIAQVGIIEVVYAQGYSMDAESEKVFAGAGVRLRQFIPPANGLIHLEKPTLY